MRDAKRTWWPVRGAYVTAQYVDDYYEGYTDDDGKITFNVKYYARYRVEVTAEGYESEVEYLYSSGSYVIELEPTEKHYMLRLACGTPDDERRVGKPIKFGGTFEYNGEPQTGREVKIYVNGVHVATGVVDQWGNYEATWIPSEAGVYKVYAEVEV